MHIFCILVCLMLSMYQMVNCARLYTGKRPAKDSPMVFVSPKPATASPLDRSVLSIFLKNPTLKLSAIPPPPSAFRFRKPTQTSMILDTPQRGHSLGFMSNAKPAKIMFNHERFRPKGKTLKVKQNSKITRLGLKYVSNGRPVHVFANPFGPKKYRASQKYGKF